MHARFIVKLGTSRLNLPWMAKNDDCQVIGTVSCGPELGYLGVTDDGVYLKVNGSLTERLDPYEMREAIRRAAATQGMSTEEALGTRKAVVVVRKKKRLMQPELA